MADRQGHPCPECGASRGADNTPSCICGRRAADALARKRTAQAAAVEDFDPLRIRPYVDLEAAGILRTPDSTEDPSLGGAPGTGTGQPARTAGGGNEPTAPPGGAAPEGGGLPGGAAPDTATAARPDRVPDAEATMRLGAVPAADATMQLGAVRDAAPDTSPAPGAGVAPDAAPHAGAAPQPSTPPDAGAAAQPGAAPDTATAAQPDRVPDAEATMRLGAVPDAEATMQLGAVPDAEATMQLGAVPQAGKTTRSQGVPRKRSGRRADGVLPTPLAPSGARPSDQDLRLFEPGEEGGAPAGRAASGRGAKRRGRPVLLASAGAAVAVLAGAGLASGLFAYDTPSRDTARVGDAREAASAEPDGEAASLTASPVRSTSPSPSASPSPSVSASPSASASTSPSPSPSSASPSAPASASASASEPASPSSSAASPSASEEPQPDPVTDTVLRRGDRGAEVVELQLRLQQLRLYTGSVNGTFNRSVENALFNYQWARGLWNVSEPGAYDQATRAVLESETSEP